MRQTYSCIILLMATMTGFGQHAETMNLNGIWEYEQTELAFPPESFTRTIPVPGLITGASPQIKQYDRLFPITRKPDKEWFGMDATEEQWEEVTHEKYKPRYNWYRKTVFIPQELEGKEVVMTLKKSKYVTQVYVNGQETGSSMACYTPIDFRVTRAIRFGADNEILVKVGDYAWLPPQAAGSSDKEKQNYIPGIWDDVFLSFTGKIRVHRCLLLPDIQDSKVAVKLQVESFHPPQHTTAGDRFDSCSMDIEIREWKSGKSVARLSGLVLQAKRFNRVTLEKDVPMPEPRLWIPNDPFLYEAVITVKQDGMDSDSYRTRFGMREFGRDGKYFTLNGERIFLRGTNITLHRFFEDPDCQDLPWDHAWVQKLLVHYPKQLHWNAMRVCVGIAPDFWYDMADEHGLLFQNEWLYWQERGWDEQIRREYTDWVWSDGNHPSIAIWDALNENWIPFIGRELIPELEHLDPSRIWDAGYMTAADMVKDDMDEPHTYTVRGYITNFEEYYDENPYQLGDLHDRTHVHNPNFFTSSAAQLVNEYAWMWLWRDGSPAKLTLKNYAYYLGEEASPEERRELQAYWTQIETEWNQVERSFAGVLSFCYLTNNYGYTGDWFIDDIKDLKPGPALHWQAHCFAPVATFIDLLDQRYTKHTRPYEPGETIAFNLVALNDHSRKVNPLTLLKLFDSRGRMVSEQEFRIPVSEYGKQYIPVNLTLPDTPGGYTLVAECRYEANQIKPVVSRRYIRVGKADSYSYYDYPLPELD